MKLIHRASPFHKSNITLEEFWSSAVEQDKFRFPSLFSRDEEDPFFPSIPLRYNDSGHNQSKGVYLLEIRIGEWKQRKYVSLILDTGSDMVWVQGRPCPITRCGISKYYDHRRSTSYTGLPSNQCLRLGELTQTPTSYYRNECYYKKAYLSLTLFGILGEEKLTFSDEKGQEDIKRSFVMGFAIKNEGIPVPDAYGIAGFGRSKLSLINQLQEFSGNKFSYCFVSFSNTLRNSSLMFGDDALLVGTPTPLFGSPKYIVRLLDISVNGERLDIPPGIFFSSMTGMIIDSGSSLTYLNRDGFSYLEHRLQRVVSLERSYGCKDKRICFYGDSVDFYNGALPHVTFHFDGGLDVTFSPQVLFRRMTDKVLEFFILPSEGLSDNSLLGAASQQNLLVGFDLMEEKAYMFSTDCVDYT